MTKLLTNYSKLHLIDQFIESFTESSNNVYYLFVSKHTEFNDDNVPPELYDNTEVLKSNFYKELIFGKKITTSDVATMIPRYNWTSNTVYSQYSDTDTSLFSKKFYVVVDNGSYYYVYKVLDNNYGSTSTVSPISSTSETACNFITTADGYMWKLMYKLDEANFEKFATTDYMPVAFSTNVSSSAVVGSIDNILVTDSGSGYVSTLTGQFQSDDVRDTIPLFAGNNTTYRLVSNAASNSSFYVGSAIYLSSGTGAGEQRNILAYNSSNRVITISSPFSASPDSTTSYFIYPSVTITGDGSGATAYAIVSSNATVNNFISSVKITNRGYNYTYASATVTGNTGGVSNTASLRVVMPPAGGHGYNAPEELGASLLGVSVKLSNTENDYVTTENDFRTYGIVRDILYDNVIFTLNQTQGTFTGTEKIYQVDYKILTGLVATGATSNTITGTTTDFTSSLKTGDEVIIFDTVGNVQCLRTVTAIANSTSLSVNSNVGFSVASALIAHAAITASGIRAGNTLPYMNLSNVEPKFYTGSKIIGSESGAWANISAININDKSYNSWNFFDNRIKINYSSSAGVIPEDSLVYQTSIADSNAYFHSSNSSFIFLTNEKGTITANPNQLLYSGNSAASYTLGSTRYEPDIVESSGKVLYVENILPVTRSNTQSEVFRVVLDF
jgi:hypothetical protein